MPCFSSTLRAVAADRLQRIAFEDYENADVDSVILAHVDLFNAN